MSQYATLYTAWKGHTAQTWTTALAGSGYCSYAGSGFISALGSIDIATNAEQKYEMTLTPATMFTFAASA
jgi:hypothetical protein